MKITGNMQDKVIAKEISERFRQYRIACSVTRAELSERSIVSVGTIARFENGSDIGLINLIKLFKALGLEENLDLLIPDPQERPSNHLSNYVEKKRVRNHKTTDRKWKWGDEE